MDVGHKENLTHIREASYSERVNERFPWCIGDHGILLIHVCRMELQLGCIPPELFQIVMFS